MTYEQLESSSTKTTESGRKWPDLSEGVPIQDVQSDCTTSVSWPMVTETPTGKIVIRLHIRGTVGKVSDKASKRR